MYEWVFMVFSIEHQNANMPYLVLLSLESCAVRACTRAAERFPIGIHRSSYTCLDTQYRTKSSLFTSTLQIRVIERAISHFDDSFCHRLSASYSLLVRRSLRSNICLLQKCNRIPVVVTRRLSGLEHGRRIARIMTFLIQCLPR